MTTLEPLSNAAIDAARAAGWTNGCGPGSWKRHTWRWYLARLLCPGLYRVCERHDVRYHLGGTEEDKRLGDEELRTGVLEHAERSGRIARWLLDEEAEAIWEIVVEEGDAHFNFRPEPKPVSSIPGYVREAA